LTAVRIEVKIVERRLVEHLAAPAIKRCFYGHLCNFGIQYIKGKSQSSTYMERPKEDK